MPAGESDCEAMVAWMPPGGRLGESGWSLVPETRASRNEPLKAPYILNSDIMWGNDLCGGTPNYIGDPFGEGPN